MPDSKILDLGERTAAPGATHGMEIEGPSTSEHALWPTIMGWIQSGLTGVFELVGVAAGLVSDHEGLADPHPQYLDQTEADARYSLLGHLHTGVYDPAGTAAQAVSDHEALGDPHPQYEADGTAAAAVSAHNTDATDGVHADVRQPAMTELAVAGPSIDVTAGRPYLLTNTGTITPTCPNTGASDEGGVPVYIEDASANLALGAFTVHGSEPTPSRAAYCLAHVRVFPGSTTVHWYWGT